jgi:hypothetical protein
MEKHARYEHALLEESQHDTAWRLAPRRFRDRLFFFVLFSSDCREHAPEKWINPSVRGIPADAHDCAIAHAIIVARFTTSGQTVPSPEASSRKHASSFEFLRERGWGTKWQGFLIEYAVCRRKIAGFRTRPVSDLL